MSWARAISRGRFLKARLGVKPIQNASRLLGEASQPAVEIFSGLFMIWTFCGDLADTIRRDGPAQRPEEAFFADQKSAGRAGSRIEQAVEMHDEIAHLGIVEGFAR